jgi:tetratricopeptide (TPR) repeat protein/serine/threonine protein kinase
MKPSPSLGDLCSGDDPALFDLAEEMAARLQSEDVADVEAWIAAQGEHAERLRRLLPTVQVMAQLGAADGSVPPGPEGEPVPGLLGDFRILRELGRGGMGIVYEAEQLSLGRRVALKVLPFAATMDPRHLQRFRNEARAAASLHHEHIVPVYAVGQDRGVHYYGMQFIDGWTLAEFLAYQRGSPPDRSDQPTTAPSPPAPDQPAAETAVAAAGTTAQLPRDAAEFRRIAKWGIQAAQALEHAHSLGIVHRDIKPGNLMLDSQGKLWITDFGLARTLADSGLTLTGDVVGTLRYMSPEQALAKHGLVDHRTDIYALGATLYEVLVLRPAFPGNDRQELLRQIAFEEPKAPRRVNGAIPTELETIVLKALEKNPAERYATAQGLADDLRNWLEDRLIKARRPGVRVRLVKWARRHRQVVASLAAGMMALLVVGVVLAFAYQRQQAEEARQAEALRRDVGAMLAQAIRFRQSAHFKESRELLEQTRQRLGPDGPPDLREQVDQALADTGLARRLDAARQRVLMGHRKLDYAGARKEYVAAWKGAGLGQEGEDAAVVAARVRGSAVRAELVAALEDWASIAGDGRLRAWLLAVVRAADPDAQRDALRQPELWRDRAALARLAREAPAAALSPQLVVAISRALADDKEALPLLRAAQERHHSDYWLNSGLAMVLYRMKRYDEAIGHCRAALAVRADTMAYNNLGLALCDKGCPDEAVRYYEKALRLDPDDPTPHYNLGLAWCAKGRPAEGIRHFKEAVRVDPRFADAHYNLGLALQGQHRLDAAIFHYREAFRIEPKFAMAHNNLGNVLRAKGRLNEAMDEYRKAIRIDRDCAEAHNNLGNVLRENGLPHEAIGELKEALRINPRLPRVHTNLALAVYDLGKFKEAVKHCEDALRLDPKHAGAHINLGMALCAMGRLDEGISHFKESLRVNPNDAEAHYNLGKVLQDKGRLDEAVSHYKEALRINPKLAPAHHNLGIALKAKGLLDEAISHYKQALHIDPKLANTHYSLGNALCDAGRLNEAVGHYEESIRIAPKNAQAHGALGQTLLILGRFAEARDATRRCLDLLPPRHPIRPAVIQQLRHCEEALRKQAREPK